MGLQEGLGQGLLWGPLVEVLLMGISFSGGTQSLQECMGLVRRSLLAGCRHRGLQGQTPGKASPHTQPHQAQCLLRTTCSRVQHWPNAG